MKMELRPSPLETVELRREASASSSLGGKIIEILNRMAWLSSPPSGQDFEELVAGTHLLIEKLREFEHINIVLTATRRIASLLLLSRPESLGKNLQQSLSILAETATADRVYIWKNYCRDAKLYCSQIYEWSGGAESQADYSLAAETLYSSVIPRWEAQLSAGHCINDIVRDMPENERAALSPQGILSILVVPIFLENQFWGFIGFDNCRRERIFSENDEIILRYTSEMIAAAISHANLATKANKIFYDPLTAIYNRYFFNEKIEELMRSMSRSGNFLGLMMIDVDRFKQYNDLYGHVKGDGCLKTVAEVLRKSLKREEDFVARYGGEEFVAVLPHVDEAGAQSVAQKILENVRAAGIFHEKSEHEKCLTISIGLTCGRVKQGLNGNDFVQKADEMLYASKQSGRNRYTFGRLGEREFVK